MVREALTGYWSLVSGLTEVTLERARTAARQLVAQGDATREQVTGLAQEIADTSKANREALLKLIRYETERAAGRLGFASTDEVTALQGRVRELERSIADLRTAADRADVPTGGRPTPAAGPAEKAPPKKAAKKAPEKTAEKAAKAPAAGPAKAASADPAKAAKAASADPAKAAKAAKKAPGKAPGKKAPATVGPRKRTADATGTAGPGSGS